MIRRALAAPRVAVPNIVQAPEVADAPSAAPVMNEREPALTSAPGRRTPSSAALLAPGVTPLAHGSVAAFPAVAAGPPRAKSRLDEEAALLAKARAELRAGRLVPAFGTLEASREKFSAPELLQEREALLIELLYRSGERTAAASRARAFLRRFPDSPHGELVRTFVGSTP